MTPATNNVYGQIVAPEGLGAVLKTVEAMLGPGCASLFRPRSSSEIETLRIRTNNADFESLPLAGGIDYLLNGSVEGSLDEIMQFTRFLSEGLAEARIEHTLQVHDGRRIVLTLPE
jgi:hypothetical protein